MEIGKSDQLTHLSLFTGIGGLDLAAEMAGFRTLGQCEWVDYPTKVLEKHWPGVPRWRDIRTLTKGDFYARTGLRTVDVISGGFPCQPFSVAGKRRGKEDDRYLWPEMLRVIQELRPAWVVGENVAGIVSMALDQVLSDLEGQGYKTRAFIFPACAVDAPHRRDRCAIVAYTQGEQGGRIQQPRLPTDTGTSGQAGKAAMADANSEKLEKPGADSDPAGWPRPSDSGDVSDTNDRGGPLRRDGQLPAVEGPGESWADHRGGAQEHGGGKWRTLEPNVGRVADGVPYRVDRLKCLGNAVVPQQFYPIFRAIAEIEEADAWSIS